MIRIPPDQPQLRALHDDQGWTTFAKAYANTVLQYCGGVQGLAGENCAGNAAAVQTQPFFEAALSGTDYCNGFANCTQ